MIQNRAQFEYSIEHHTNIIFIEDIGQEAKSVTNDIENVLASIKFDIEAKLHGDRDAVEFNFDNYRIIYRDSDGLIDGIITDDGKFSGFYGIQERDYNDAVRKIKSWQEMPHAAIQSFKVRTTYEPTYIHFIKTGFKDSYFVCSENPVYGIHYGLQNGEGEIESPYMTKQQIEERYKIKLTI